jgi:Peptidase family M48
MGLSMRISRATFVLFFTLTLAPWGLSQNTSAGSEPASRVPDPTNSSITAPSSFDEVIGRVVEREHYLNEQILRLHPLIETYIQNLKNDDVTGPVPVSDRYFLGRLDLTGDLEDRFADQAAGQFSVIARLNILPQLSELYSLRFRPGGFAQMVLVDRDFNRKAYGFTYVRREFLGEIRCVVIDVQPKGGSGDGRFVGRIWAEDENYNIVRFNGTYSDHANTGHYLHFDSWRLNMTSGMWLPAFVYSEESDDHRGVSGKDLHFKAQTRLWGYALTHTTGNAAFTEIVVDSGQSVRDQTDSTQDASPVQGERMWEREAEDNVLERLQKTGVMAPEGEVDRVMQTVVNNLIFTNNLNIQPEVRTRVLLTTPLESFTIGHTIVLSRGLLDVLPDEASLAMILAHELGHLALGHRLDTKFAFNDRMFFADESTFSRFDFTRDPAEERAADRKAMELLANSPYKGKLSDAGLFLRALQREAPELKSLIRPHLGTRLASGNATRMSALVSSSPALEPNQTNQIAALPLGARIRLDPWSCRVELVKGKPATLTTFREKMPFEITPFFPYLVRLASTNPDRVALKVLTK